MSKAAQLAPSDRADRLGAGGKGWSPITYGLTSAGDPVGLHQQPSCRDQQVSGYAGGRSRRLTGLVSYRRFTPKFGQRNLCNHASAGLPIGSRQSLRRRRRLHCFLPELHSSNGASVSYPTLHPLFSQSRIPTIRSVRGMFGLGFAIAQHNTGAWSGQSETRHGGWPGRSTAWRSRSA
jgi:hypothetical protein